MPAKFGHFLSHKLKITELEKEKVFALNGENYKYKKFNWEKVARMRRKRGARRL